MENIRSGILTLLTGTTGIGIIFDHRRIIDDPELFDSVYVSGGKVNSWQFYNTDIAEDGVGLGGIEDRTFGWDIEGWYAFADSATLASSSDFAFDALVEAICAKFRGSYRIGGATNENGPITDIVKEITQMGSVRCHHCKMSLRTAKTGL